MMEERRGELDGEGGAGGCWRPAPRELLRGGRGDAGAQVGQTGRKGKQIPEGEESGGRSEAMH